MLKLIAPAANLIDKRDPADVVEGMRRFHLVRFDDESGVSGTGTVAEGVEFSNGTVALTWLTPMRSAAFYPNIKEVVSIHGHGGKTIVKWLGDASNEEQQDIRDCAFSAGGDMALREREHVEDVLFSALNGIVHALNNILPPHVTKNAPTTNGLTGGVVTTDYVESVGRYVRDVAEFLGRTDVALRQVIERTVRTARALVGEDFETDNKADALLNGEDAAQYLYLCLMELSKRASEQTDQTALLAQRELILKRVSDLLGFIRRARHIIAALVSPPQTVAAFTRVQAEAKAFIEESPR